MKPRFWLERWRSNQIGFHQAEHNPLLLEFWPQLRLPDQSRVFVPLCGKSDDMRWLAAQGHSVLGVELARLAVEGFFVDQPFEQSVVDRFVSYQAAGVELLQGDFFDLSTPLLEGVQGVFDRGGLVALPRDMRFRYVDHMLRILPVDCRIMLLTLEYDQAQISGPPHAIEQDEVESLYGLRCEVELLDSFVTSALPPEFVRHGVARAAESVYLITKRQ